MPSGDDEAISLSKKLPLIQLTMGLAGRLHTK